MNSDTLKHSNTFKKIILGKRSIDIKESKDDIFPKKIKNSNTTRYSSDCDCDYNKRVCKSSNVKQITYKKGILVFDLDHTLIHSTYHLCARTLTNHEIHHNPEFSTKFRPKVKEMLQKIRFSFHIFIYTMGCRDYATRIINLLDPDHKILSPRRIVARDDYPSDTTKSLLRLPIPNIQNLVLSNYPIVIVDDRKDIWCIQDQNKVIEVEPFFYFNEVEPHILQGICPLMSTEFKHFKHNSQSLTKSCSISILNEFYNSNEDTLLTLADALIKFIQPFQPLAGVNILFVIKMLDDIESEFNQHNTEFNQTKPEFNQNKYEFNQNKIKTNQKNRAIENLLQLADKMGACCYIYRKSDRLNMDSIQSLNITHIATCDYDLLNCNQVEKYNI